MTPVLVEIKGVQFVNKGAELMLQAIAGRLQRLMPGTEIALTPGPHASFRDVANAGAWQRLRLTGVPVDVDAWSYRLPQRLMDVGRRYGIVTERDVAVVLDASGFAYGAAWGDAALAETAKEIQRLSRHDKPYVFLPQAFGPFHDSPATRAFGRALSAAALVCARDEESRAHLAALTGDHGDRLLACPDITITLPGTGSAAARWDIHRDTALLIPNAHMQDERSPDPAWQRGYVDLLTALARRLASRGLVPRVLNHEGALDAALCTRLAEALGSTVVAEPDPRGIKGIIGAAGVVISSRFHGCVSALSQGVPCLGTSWSHKYAALFEDFGCREFLIEACDETRAASALERLLADRETIATGLLERTRILESQVESMWQRVESILNSARSG